jgi:ribosomal protein S1
MSELSFEQMLEESLKTIRTGEIVTGKVIDVKEESDIDSLFSAGGTSALMSNISGLDDFELICFLVVK